MNLYRRASLRLVLLAAVTAPGTAWGQPLAQRLVFNSLAPCRIADTRQASAGALAAGETRAFHVIGSASDFAAQGGAAGGCGIPGFAGPLAQTQAVAFNFVAVAPGGPGNLRAWPADQPVPNASIINYAQVAGLNVANGIALPVRQDSEGGDLNIRADGSGAHVVVDVVGYYRLVTQLDGSGSGIDADALDGLDAAAFAAAAHNHDSQYAALAHNHDAAYWKLDGNAGTTPGTHFLGTTDAQPLELKVNGARVLRLEPGVFSPNVIGGLAGNLAAPGVSAATIGGGGNGASINRVLGNHGTVAGGSGNRAGLQAAVAGGLNNNASGIDAAIGGGNGNVASGRWGIIPGGLANAAAGLVSFAAGRRAKANHDGTFAWADGTDADLATTAANQFVVRAAGGFWLGATSSVDIPAGVFLNTSTGAHLTTGGAWTNASDAALKENFEPVDSAAVLEAVARLPLTSWNYRREDDAVRHLGPTAQDFRAAFGLGADERTITTVDSAGVALAAIQELERRTRQVEALTREVRELREQMNALRASAAPK